MKSFNALIYICLISLLSACATGPEKSVDEIISDAVRGQTDKPLDAQIDGMSAEDYIGLASESSGKQREQYLLKAAELLYQRGDLGLAKSQLETLDAETSARSRQHQISLLAAKIALANENPKQALELLPELNELPPAQYIEANEINADASLALGYPLDAVRIRVGLDRYLETAEQQENNHIAIWAALQRTPDISLKASSNDNKTTRGWIALAGELRSAQMNVSALQDRILDWGTRYPDHPVSDLFISKLLDDQYCHYVTHAR